MSTINILHLYPNEMNLYGDHGNILALKRRLEWRGYDANVITYEPGDTFPDNIDIIFGGGGQDSGQSKIEQDLINIGPEIKALIDSGTPALLVCGLYQLFGEYFQTAEGKRINGIAVLNAHTVAGSERLIGNIVIHSERFGEITGYENHSGLTHIGDNCEPFGKVLKGAGNNGTDGTEGIIYQNCIGTYLHGPVLPKNPAVADFLISKAIERKTNAPVVLQELNDEIELNAHKVAASRPR